MLELVNEYTPEDKQNHQKAKEMIIEKFLKTGIVPKITDFSELDQEFILANSKCGYTNTLISCKLDYATPFVFKSKTLFKNTVHTSVYKFIVSLYENIPPENIDLSYRNKKSVNVVMGTANRSYGFTTSVTPSRIREGKFKEMYLVLPFNKFLDEKYAKFETTYIMSNNEKYVSVYLHMNLSKLALDGNPIPFKLLEQERIHTILRAINTDENYHVICDFIHGINKPQEFPIFMMALYPYIQAKLNNQPYSIDTVISNALMKMNELNEYGRPKPVSKISHPNFASKIPEEPKMSAVETPKEPVQTPVILKPIQSISRTISNVHSDFYVTEAELDNNVWSFNIDSGTEDLLLIGTDNNVIKNAWRIPRKMVSSKLIIIYDDNESNKFLNKFTKFETVDVDYLNSLIA